MKSHAKIRAKLLVSSKHQVSTVDLNSISEALKLRVGPASYQTRYLSSSFLFIYLFSFTQGFFYLFHRQEHSSAQL